MNSEQSEKETKSRLCGFFTRLCRCWKKEKNDQRRQNHQPEIFEQIDVRNRSPIL